MMSLVRLPCVSFPINVGKVHSDKELEDLCDLAVRASEELIDHQNYPIKAAEMPLRAADHLELGLLVWLTIWLN